MKRAIAIVQLPLLCCCMVAIAASAYACDWWVVQGIIDWTVDYPYRPTSSPPGVYPIYRDGYPEGLHGWAWDTPSGNRPLNHYAAYDGDIYLPHPEQIDSPVTFRIMAGGVMLLKGYAAPPNVTVDFYQIWRWEDVNNNGKADESDTVNGAQQNWECLMTIQTPAINQAIDVIHNQVELQAGKSYLFLIRVVADGKSNLQFEGHITVAWPTLTIMDWNDLLEEGWADTGPKRYTHNWSAAVENREVLSFRVNNPPALPVVPK